MIWTALGRQPLLDVIGLLPEIFLDGDPRPAAEQAADRYAHGGGWRPQDGWELHPDGVAVYPGDPPQNALAMATLHDNEVLLVFPHSYVAIVQPDGSFEMARMD